MPEDESSSVDPQPQAAPAAEKVDGQTTASTATMMRLVLIGDIHAYRQLVAPWSLLGKRLFGQANVWLKRRYHFDRALLAPVVERAAALAPDLVLLSGDLTSTALPGEFDDVVRALAPLAGRIPTIAVAGNHDRYTFGAARRRQFEAAAGAMVAEPFPHFRRLEAPAERWALLALDAAVPRIISSRGVVGKVQLEVARQQLAELTADDGLIVLCHYALRRPPGLGEMPWHHRLADAAGVDKLLADFPGPVLYLHGHVHHPWCWRRDEPGLEHVLDINAGAPCLCQRDHPRGQGFWQIDLPADPGEAVGLWRHVPQADTGDSHPTGSWRTVQMA